MNASHEDLRQAWLTKRRVHGTDSANATLRVAAGTEDLDQVQEEQRDDAIAALTEGVMAPNDNDTATQADSVHQDEGAPLAQSSLTRRSNVTPMPSAVDCFARWNSAGKRRDH